MKAFNASQVSVGEAGDYYQVMFEQGLDGSGQYLVIQRSFEMPDDGRCYVEDEALAIVGHYRAQEAELGRGHFSAELGRPGSISVRVTFDVPEAEFLELARVIKIMLPDVLLARDVPELAQYLCDVPREIMDRLDRGQAGFLEIAQGFQLSYLLPEFYPFCTSRNCTVAAGLDDMMLPPCYAGNVLLNYRTFPIRTSNYKYIAKERHEAIEVGAHLTWSQVQLFEKLGLEYEKYEGNSGPGYPDQEEVEWDTITKDSGSLDPIMEMASVTKLPRRAFTFSRRSVEESIRHNRTDGRTFISVNFVNYVDAGLLGDRGHGWNESSRTQIRDWCRRNIPTENGELTFLGTGPRTDDFILV